MEFIDRFRREGRVQAAMSHPHVVTVYETGTSDHGPWLAMRLVLGTTLADEIAEGIDSQRALALVGQAAEGLDAAHAAGLVHRDVTPRNILVEGDEAYLADFGLSRPSEGAPVTETGGFFGTFAYAAPEALAGPARAPPPTGTRLRPSCSSASPARPCSPAPAPPPSPSPTCTSRPRACRGAGPRPRPSSTG